MNKIDDAVFKFKHRLIKGALELNDGNACKTARMLGIHRNNLNRWIHILGLTEFVKQTRAERIKIRLFGKGAA